MRAYCFAHVSRQVGALFQSLCNTAIAKSKGWTGERPLPHPALTFPSHPLWNALSERSAMFISQTKKIVG